MTISPFTPLFFPGSNPSDGVPSRNVQLFASTDHIMVQVCVGLEETEPQAYVNNLVTEDMEAVEWQEWEMTDKVILFTVLTGLDPGTYTFSVGDAESDLFRVTADEALLSATTLLQYRFKDNRQRDDVVSVIEGQPYFFDFRVPGGFKDSGWQFGVENEQFATQRQDLVELYAYDYVAKQLTIGGTLGVPVWYGEMLNRLLTCSYVYVNGERYVRSDSETPSMNILVDGLDSFVFTQLLRKALIRDASIEALNQLAIRRVDEDYDRITDNEDIRTLNDISQ